MQQISRILPTLLVLVACIAITATAEDQKPAKQEGKTMAKDKSPEYKIRPIGWVRKADGKTTIVIEKKYQQAMLGLEKYPEVWVLYWFDRNDTPEKRSILQVHPRGDKRNPIRGVFATHSPVRPNLIAMTRCKILSIKENVIEIEEIDAFADTPVIDIKN